MSSGHVAIIILVITVVLFILYIIGKKRAEKDENNKRHICYHTLSDCEECMSSSTCNQKTGLGLIHTKEDY